MRGLFVTAVFCLAASAAQGQAPPAAQNEKPKDSRADADCPMHKAHAHDDSTSSAMNDRGEKGMGFSQTTTTHHFLLSADGGVIQVETNDPTDTATRDNIRMHLTHVTKAFAGGDFAIPMFVHDTTPPGVSVMKQLKDKIRYKFEETPGGARVVIATADADALAAVLQFLKFQIAEHKTGDSTAVH
ncbi:MAG: hypothetical protein QOF94_2075 [Acidobacteriaceae bacterium]